MSAVAKQLHALHAEQAADPPCSNKSDQVRGLLRLSVELFEAQRLFYHLHSNSGMPSDRAATATATTGTELALTVLRYTTKELAQHQQQQRQQQHQAQQQPSHENSLWSTVTAALQYLQQARTLEGLGELEAPEAQRLLPNATRICSMLAVLNLYCARLQSLQLPAVDDMGATSSGSTGSSSSRASHAPAASGYAGATDAWVWQVVSTNLQQLPDVAPVLAKCMGLSKLQLACIAAHMLRSDTAAVDMGMLLDTWRAVLDGTKGELESFKVVEGLTQLELSGLLLGWVAALPSTEQQFVSYSSCAAYCTALALQSFAVEHRRQQPQQQQQQEQYKMQQQLMRLLSPWADSAMPALLSIMSAALVRAKAEATGASSSSSDSSSCSGAGVLQSLLEALTNCVQLLDVLGDATAVRAGSSSCLQFAPVWGAHGVEVVSLLERYTRLLLSLEGSQHSELKLIALKNVYALCQHSSMGGVGVLLALAVQALTQQVERLHDAEPPTRGSWQVRYPRRFLSLLLSALKLASSLEAADRRLCFCLAAANVCSQVLVHCTESNMWTVWSANIRLDCMTGSNSSAASSSSGEMLAAQQSEAASSAVWLPWLVLLGRCCLYAGTHIAGVVGVALSRDAVGQLDALRSQTSNLRLYVVFALESLVRASAALNALELVLKQVRELISALRALVVKQPPGTAAADDAAETVVELAPEQHATAAQRLRAFGATASSIPVAAFCNNPGCGTVCGQSEAELVLGPKCVCVQCRVARYCSKECQSLHWAVHKPACKALAAASAAGGRA